MGKDVKVKELIKKYLPLRAKEGLGYLKDYSNLVSSNLNDEDKKVLLWNLLRITGIDMKEFQKEMVESKASYTDVYRECLNIEKEL